MSSNECVIPECYIDSCLIEVLLHVERDHVNHQKGNGTVAREWTSIYYSDATGNRRMDLIYLRGTWNKIEELQFARIIDGFKESFKICGIKKGSAIHQIVQGFGKNEKGTSFEIARLAGIFKTE